jgi:DNA-binding transcriptional regulator YiaG
MTPELKEATRALGLNNRTFAALIGTGEDTVCGWGKRYRDHRGVQ